MKIAWLPLVVLSVLPFSASCDSTSSNSAGSNSAGVGAGANSVAIVAVPKLTETKPLDLGGVHNVVAYGDGLYSGSAPEGDHAFSTLAAMGVKTIISVDGAIPDVEAAKKEGLRYVHLPIQYSGIESERSKEIARAVRDLPKPIYLHCHHGKHRSAAALGSAAVQLGLLKPEEAVARMKVSGTAPTYKGLYACVENSTLRAASDLDAVTADFPEVAKPSGIVEAMVELDERLDHLKECEKAGWTPSREHPDLVALAELSRFSDLYRQLEAEAEWISKHDAKFAEMLKASAKRAEDFEAALDSPVRDLAKFSAFMKDIAADCKSCHVGYRD